jgi:hypothetical protein
MDRMQLSEDQFVDDDDGVNDDEGYWNRLFVSWCIASMG